MAPPGGLDDGFRKIKVDTVAKKRISSSPFAQIEKAYGSPVFGSAPASDTLSSHPHAGKSDVIGSLDSIRLADSSRSYGHGSSSKRALSWQLGGEGIDE